MNILIACEESQAVTKQFREKGHNAFSCDIIKHSGEHDNWHIQQDVFPLLNGNCEFQTVDGNFHYIEGKWDMIIAFPPCTDLCVSGARHFEKKREDGRQETSINFFMSFMNADCDKIAIENPIGIISGEYISKHFPHLQEKYCFPRKPSQIIQPWNFGDNEVKSTCLWLKGLPNLVEEIKEKPEIKYFEWIDKNGIKKKQGQWYMDALRLSPSERAKMRSKTFPGIARAMAEQWG